MNFLRIWGSLGLGRSDCIVHLYQSKAGFIETRGSRGDFFRTRSGGSGLLWYEDILVCNWIDDDLPFGVGA